uniref:SMP-30/Gluconolactonase/LRE-like region domain-containing protein n=1 Tax=Eiseniibacteriota bacterium TaxID=2212470 RepID=A0A832I3Y6_UNCEI
MPLRTSLRATLALLALIAAAPAAATSMYITSDASDLLRRYDPASGAFLGVFTASTFGPAGQLGVHFNATNTRLLVGHWGGGVQEFDAATGAPIQVFAPGGGPQWGAVYTPWGNVFIGSWNTNDVREYDGTTGAFVRVLASMSSPADMRYGPNGNLYVCSWMTGMVLEIDPVSGNILGATGPLPGGGRSNDVVFLPNGEMLVTAMGPDSVYRYSPGGALLGSFGGTGMASPHGIELDPVDGTIRVVSGGGQQLHVFDPVTFAEITPSKLVPGPGDKIVDIAYGPDPQSTPVERTSWGELKRRWR